MIWRFLDIFFFLFHTFIVIFNLTGWIWRRTRKYNLILLLLTGGSWLFLGLLVGTPGYCPLTEYKGLSQSSPPTIIQSKYLICIS